MKHGDGDWQDTEEPVPLTRTPCNYGKGRCWFVCPGVVNGRYCGRRVAVLYGAGGYFLCRRCYGLSYGSQNESPADRAMRRAWKVGESLGGRPGWGYPTTSG